METNAIAANLEDLLIPQLPLELKVLRLVVCKYSSIIIVDNGNYIIAIWHKPLKNSINGQHVLDANFRKNIKICELKLYLCILILRLFSKLREVAED